jgi:hypothetical protein
VLGTRCISGLRNTATNMTTTTSLSSSESMSCIKLVWDGEGVYGSSVVGSDAGA